MNYRTLLFDFDETLICSKPTYYAAYRHAVYSQLGSEATESLFHDLWNQAISPQQAFARLGEESVEALMEAFEWYYYTNHHHTLAAYPAIIDMLARLRAAGLQLAIVSLKPRRAGEKELDICGLREFFDVVIWGDDVPKPKPAPDGCLRALHELQADSRRALVCGDSPADIKMGRAAGIHTAAALWGEANRELLLATTPDYAFEHPNELLRALSLEN